jgi:hypothetical protein
MMVVNYIQFTTANDAPERDPTIIEIQGYPGSHGEASDYLTGAPGQDLELTLPERREQGISRYRDLRLTGTGRW